MTTIPFAAQALGSPNITKGAVTRPPRGMVLHIAQGSYQGTIGWEHNPQAQVSSYCVVSKAGEITQVVDLDDKAWTQSAGNREWIGIEFEGFVPAPLTPAQVTAAARLLAFLHTTYGVPLVVTDDPVNGRGLAWHGMGGDAWGGHQGCPGAAIVAQRPEIIQQAEALIGDDVTTPAQVDEIVARTTKAVLDGLVHAPYDGKTFGRVETAVKRYLKPVYDKLGI